MAIRPLKGAKSMKDTILAQIMGLKGLSTEELQKKYEELYDGEKTPSNNKIYLWRKLAFRIQELEYGSTRSPEAGNSSLARHLGGLSEEAQSRVNELTEEYDPVNNKALRLDDIVKDTQKIHSRDRRLPIPGTIITKEYKGNSIQVKVLNRGFEYKNKVYRSLTALAKDITGCHWSGYDFFNL